jgi:hypothetical protein
VRCTAEAYSTAADTRSKTQKNSIAALQQIKDDDQYTQYSSILKSTAGMQQETRCKTALNKAAE